MLKHSAEKMTVQTGRNGVNLKIMLVTILFLSVALVVGDVSFTTRISGISQDLGKALNKVLDFEETNYTEIQTNVTYVSEVTYNAKGMAGLYNITHWFMDLIQPREVFPKDVQITDNTGNIQISKVIEQWPALLKHYAGLLSVTIIGLLFAVLMPLVGFIFCCCRCCGNCGARSQPFDKKHDMCKKVLLSMFLIAIATLILFGVVCAFVSNQHMQEGTEELPDSLRNSLSDVKTYLKQTNSQIDTLLTTNFDELRKTLFTILDNSSKIIYDKLIDYSNAVSFTNLVAFVEGLGDVSSDLNSMQNSTNNLRVKASQLNDGLRRVKHELLHTLNQCHSQKCREINQEVGKLSTNMDFDNLPDVSKAVINLQKFIDGPDSLVQNIEQGRENFEKIPQSIKDAVDSSIPDIRNSINDAGKSLKDGSQDVSETLKKLIKIVDENGDRSVDDTDNFLKNYSIYRYYIGLFMSSTLLIVIMCVTFGLMCGICGKRPDGYDDDCCNKGAGSKFLMLGVAVMFLFSVVLMLLTLAYFLSGVIVQRLACDTLRNTNDSQVFDIIDNSVDLKSYIHSDLVTVIRSCHQNQSAYEVLNLKNKLDVADIKNYLDKYNISKEIDEIQSKITLDKNIVILSNKSKERVIELRDSEIANINFHKFTEILSNNLTSIDLDKLADDLEEARKSIEGERGTEALDMSIKQNVMYLRMYQANLVVPMIQIAEDLKVKAEHLDHLLKFNKSDFQTAINETLDEIISAQNYIQKNGTANMRKLAEEFANGFKLRVNVYLERVADKVSEDVGQCGPLSNVYNATLVATCDKILNPWNGFWLSVGWCLILFIPTIVLSVKLGTLYQKSDPYPGPLVEAEYLYDAYADRDNIPLSNVNLKQNKKKKKKQQKRGGDVGVYESRGGGAGDAGARERDAPGGSSHPDTRYADMAPKHWEDYPNGGPPQYQSAPLATEYERPPPYYYPGPGDRP